MTQVVTMSANTAAYAAEAVKPSARISGDRPAQETVTLLSSPVRDAAVTIPPRVAAAGDSPALSLMLMSAHRRLAQGTREQAIHHYMEFGEAIPEDDGDESEPEAAEDHDLGEP